MILGQEISYRLPHTSHLIFSNLSFILNHEKSGLIGRNGIGKTTLIKLILGELSPSQGHLELTTQLGYLPQNYQFSPSQTLADIFGIREKLFALERINLGQGNLQDFEILDEDWNIIERYESYLQRVGFETSDFSRRIESLSGGELTKAALARLIASESEFLILDEPTNNLDFQSKQILYQFIENWQGGLLVVSHDRELLDKMEQIIEFTTLGLKVYGGNYTEYRHLKSLDLEAAERDYQNSKKEGKKVKKEIQRHKEKKEKLDHRGKKQRQKKSQPKVLLNALRDKSEKTKSKMVKLSQKQLENSQQRIFKAQQKVEFLKELAFKIPPSQLAAGKEILKIENLFYVYPNTQKAIFEDFSFNFNGPKRIAITGKNGAGKSTLLKLITGELIALKGEIRVGTSSWSYLDQKTKVLNAEDSILENFKRYQPLLPESECRTLLAHFLFQQEEVFKKAKELSGGEKLRAALACILMKETPPQLILLDEPTNHLDLESLQTIESALNQYDGALVVISHDQTFLKHLKIETKIKL